MDSRHAFPLIHMAILFVCAWIFILIIMGVTGLNFGDRFLNIVVSLGVTFGLCRLAIKARS